MLGGPPARGVLNEKNSSDGRIGGQTQGQQVSTPRFAGEDRPGQQTNQFPRNEDVEREVPSQRESSASQRQMASSATLQTDPDDLRTVLVYKTQSGLDAQETQKEFGEREILERNGWLTNLVIMKHGRGASSLFNPSQTN
eukprot:TRINITY_DN5105_c0_g1_i5.p2 TRINITY_DN5105_c0_g1~~TRINITY_DN5105_c0_g1_i5.p2  ORF type:complete len:140 (-),score=36.37 TRINITY_DN5105_c0_g1_i5:3-422(-)